MSILAHSHQIDVSQGCQNTLDLKLLDKKFNFPVFLRVGCNRRFEHNCPICAKKWKIKNFHKFKSAIASFRNPRFLTLTVRYYDDLSLNRSIDELWHLRNVLFKRLKFRKYNINAWIAVIESTTTGFFNHIHIIYDGDFIPQNILSAIWKEITQDSYIVDIRFLDFQRRSILSGYLSKYLSKLTFTGNCDELNGAHLIASHGLKIKEKNPFVVNYNGLFEVGHDGWRKATFQDDLDGLLAFWEKCYDRYLQLTTHQSKLIG